MLYNSTVTANYISGSNGYGAGLFISPSFSSDTSQVINSVFWDNEANGSPHREVTATGSAQPKIKVIHSIVEGGFNSTLYSEDANVDTAFVQAADPLFVAPVPASSAPATGGDYHLQLCSPAVNAGDNMYVSTASDLDSTARIKQLIVDLGAYESNYTTCTTGIKNHAETGAVSVYPNPSAGMVHVQFPEAFTGTITIVDATGAFRETIKTKNQAVHVLDMTPYTDGIYWLQAEKETAVPIRVKIVKTH